MCHLAAAGSVLLAAVTIAPVAVPLGLLAGALAWSRRILAMRTGTGGLTPSAPAAFDRRQWRHQVRSARARIAAPGAVPLLSRNGPSWRAPSSARSATPRRRSRRSPISGCAPTRSSSAPPGPASPHLERSILAGMAFPQVRVRLFPFGEERGQLGLGERRIDGHAVE